MACASVWYCVYIPNSGAQSLRNIRPKRVTFYRSTCWWEYHVPVVAKTTTPRGPCYRRGCKFDHEQSRLARLLKMTSYPNHRSHFVPCKLTREEPSPLTSCCHNISKSRVSGDLVIPSGETYCGAAVGVELMLYKAPNSRNSLYLTKKTIRVPLKNGCLTPAYRSYVLKHII